MNLMKKTAFLFLGFGITSSVHAANDTLDCLKTFLRATLIAELDEKGLDAALEWSDSLKSDHVLKTLVQVEIQLEFFKICEESADEEEKALLTDVYKARAMFKESLSKLHRFRDRPVVSEFFPEIRTKKWCDEIGSSSYTSVPSLQNHKDWLLRAHRFEYTDCMAHRQERSRMN